MRPLLMTALAGALLLTVAPRGHAQSADYPPASGHMVIIPPSYPAPGGLGSDYVETFPGLTPNQATAPATVQPVVPGTRTVGPRVRARGQRGARVYSRGYQAPAPYATQLPQGQLYWPGSYMAPGYTPFSRYQTYGQGYVQSPYGSNYWGGYYKGFALGY